MLKALRCKGFHVVDMSPRSLGPSRLVVAHSGPVLAELAGDGLSEALVLGSQLGDEDAHGIELLTERVGGGLLGGGTGADGG